METKFWEITLKFDYGKFKIITTATTKEAAIKKICLSENCPESAIIGIQKHSGLIIA